MTRTRTTAASIALTIVFAACGGTGAPQASDPARTAPSTTEPSAGRATDTTGQTPGGSPDDVADALDQLVDGGGSGPSSSAPTPPGASGDTEQAPAPASPARAGAYRYDTEGTTTISNGPPRELPKVTTLTIDPPANDRQRTLRDLRDGDGAGSTTEQILVYATDGVHLAYLKLEANFAGIRSSYEFRPADPPLVVRTGGQPGDQTSFTLEGDGVTIQATATVKGTEDVNVGGTVVSALVLEVVSTASGELKGTQTSISWIDPDRSLTVKEDVDSDVTSGPVRVRTNYVASVRALSP